MTMRRASPRRRQDRRSQTVPSWWPPSSPALTDVRYPPAAPPMFSRRRAAVCVGLRQGATSHVVDGGCGRTTQGALRRAEKRRRRYAPLGTAAGKEDGQEAHGPARPSARVPHRAGLRPSSRPTQKRRARAPFSYTSRAAHHTDFLCQAQLYRAGERCDPQGQPTHRRAQAGPRLRLRRADDALRAAGPKRGARAGRGGPDGEP